MRVYSLGASGVILLLLATVSAAAIASVDKDAIDVKLGSLPDPRENSSSKKTSPQVLTNTDDIVPEVNSANPGDFIEAFVASLVMILVSEVGDKTFFIAAILAMKHPRMVIFSGALSALVFMTALSAALGYAVPTLLPHAYTHWLSVAFFAFFGVKMMREWYVMKADEGMEELEETEGELSKIEKEKDTTPDLETGDASVTRPNLRMIGGFKNLLYLLFTPIFIQTFTLTFLAEWGDRSQITTIAMATTKNPYGITLGGIAGHAVCTGLAVVGGRLLATRISVRTVTLLGAVLFLVFAVMGFLQPDS